jgi:alkanesulfonate monooxygenase SsuD/methylene tetrahydromethanopterin reductase-like flavin-dependent oxidoreductase (luciferase family)
LALGVPYPPIAERFERMEETIQICLQMWSENNGPYSGRHYELAETLCAPQPLGRPRPEIMIGGAGEKKTLLLAARYADACNLFGTSVEDVKRKLDVLRGHCEGERRDYEAMEKTVLLVRPVLTDIEGTLTDAEQYARVGVTEVQTMPDREPVEFATEIAEKVLPRLASIG